MFSLDNEGTEKTWQEKRWTKKKVRKRERKTKKKERACNVDRKAKKIFCKSLFYTEVRKDFQKGR